MRRLKTLFESNPGYTKWGNARLAAKLKLKEKTVESYKKTTEFKDIKNAYICSKKSL